jgi:hypothetical protein
MPRKIAELNHCIDKNNNEICTLSDYFKHIKSPIFAMTIPLKSYSGDKKKQIKYIS